MLLVLEPFAFIFFSVRERVDALSLTFALDILSCVGVAVLIDSCSLAMWLACLHLAFVGTAVSCCASSERYFLCVAPHGQKSKHC